MTSATDIYLPREGDPERTGKVTMRLKHGSEQIAAATAHGLTFDLVTRREDFDALSDEWSDLYARAARPENVFQSFGFLWHWANAYLPSQTSGQKDRQKLDGPALAILIGRRSGRLDFVWPLVREKHTGLTTLSWMGEPVAQYGDCLIAPEIAGFETLAAAYETLKQRVHFDVLHLRRVRADAAIASFLEHIGAKPADLRVAPFIKFDGASSFNEFEQRYPAKKRANRRRLARRLHELHKVEIRRPAPGPEAQALAKRAVELKTEWLAQRGLYSPAFTSPAFKKFFIDAAAGKTFDAACQTSALIADGTVAAINVTFVSAGVGHLHVLAYDPAFEKNGVGVILLEDELRHAADNGQAGFDFLAPAARYKEDWAEGVIEVRDWSQPVSAFGRAYSQIYLAHVRPALRAIVQSLPAVLRQRLSRTSLKAQQQSVE